MRAIAILLAMAIALSGCLGTQPPDEIDERQTNPPTPPQAPPKPDAGPLDRIEAAIEEALANA